MFSKTTFDAVIGLGGVGAGLVLGSLSNISQTGSLFEAPYNANRNNSFLYKYLENDRNNVINTSSNPAKPKLWNPFLPAEQLIPLCLVGITQIFIASRTPGTTARNVAILSTKYTFTVIALPCLYVFAIITGT